MAKIKLTKVPFAGTPEQDAKLTEKLDELQSVGVNIRTQQVNGQIQRMADKKHQNKYNGADDTAAQHAAHRVDYSGDNAGSQAQSQQSGIRKNVRQIACYAIQSVSAF